MKPGNPLVKYCNDILQNVDFHDKLLLLVLRIRQQMYMRCPWRGYCDSTTFVVNAFENSGSLFPRQDITMFITH